ILKKSNSFFQKQLGKMVQKRNQNQKILLLSGLLIADAIDWAGKVSEGGGQGEGGIGEVGGKGKIKIWFKEKNRMSEPVADFLTLTNLLNVLLYSLGVWIPVYLTHWYHRRGERRKEIAFNQNTLVLLDQELAMIRKTNEKIRKSCHRITDTCK